VSSLCPSADGGTDGIYVKNDTTDESYPIYYWRGSVENNLIFADHCWKMVRTTNTGGLKILYNGIPVNGVCDNTGEASVIARSKFNNSTSSLAYGGYMYNDDTTYDLSTAAGRTNYKSHLADELRLDNGTGRHIQNKYDSTIKEVIDDWYEANILNTKYESMLEDTVWCNNRNVTSDTYSIDNYSLLIL